MQAQTTADFARSRRSSLIAAIFLMATSAIGPGFITQTTEFTVQLGAAFAFAILVSILVDIAVQLNVWRVIGVSGLRAQELGNRVLPGLGYAMAGESFELPPGTIHPADLEQGEFAKEWAVLGEKLLAAGKIRPHPVSVREGGLEAVVAAIEEVRGSGPRGVKIVCTA